MKAPACLPVLLGILLCHHTNAQDDTAHHRAVYAEINQHAASYQHAKATHRDDPIVFQLEGWFDGPALRKILATVPGEDGNGSEEYYLEDGQPLFVFRRYQSGRKSIEDRFYFRQGRMFKWLGSDRHSIAPGSPDFTSEAARLTGNCAHFIAAFKSRAAAKPAATRTTDGTFIGIEEGDYAHWLMRTASGKDVSFFILHPDASVEKILENARAYQGRKCRATWKESTENIPEAGGRMKIEQILSVEWLGKR